MFLAIAARMNRTCVAGITFVLTSLLCTTAFADETESKLIDVNAQLGLLVRMNGDGPGYSYTLNAMARVSPKWRLGASYRAGEAISFYYDGPDTGTRVEFRHAGGRAEFHPQVKGVVDPWLGVGFGAVHVDSKGIDEAGYHHVTGWWPELGFMAGLDFRITSAINLGINWEYIRPIEQQQGAAGYSLGYLTALLPNVRLGLAF